MNTILSLCAAVVLAAVPVAKVPELMIRIDESRAAIERKDYVQAEAALTGVVAAAREADDRVAAARAHFFLGRSKQQQAAVATGETAQALRNAAIAEYEQSLELYPESGATLYNLAELLADLRNYARARSLMAQALELDDPRRAVFAEKLGDLAAAEGQHKEAVAAFERAVAAGGASPQLRQKLIQHTLAAGADIEELIPHVWQLAKGDHADIALSSALRALASTGELDSGEADAFFAILAHALARQNYSPAELSAIGVLKQLIELQARDDRRERIAAILRLYDPTSPDLAVFTAWPATIEDDDLPADLSPKKALADLATALGRRTYNDGADQKGAAREETLRRAAWYFNVALQLLGPTDARLMTDIVLVYNAQNRLTEVENLLGQFEDSVAAGLPGEDLYVYHRTMGTIYAAHKRWTNTQEPRAAALHHLEQSVSIGNAIRSSAVVEKDLVASDGNVKRLLGDAYAVAGRREESTNALLDAAATFRTSSDIASVRDVIGRIAPSRITDDAARASYADAVDPLVTFIGEWPQAIADRAAVKGSLVILATSTDAAVREDARKKLEELGVRVMGGTTSGEIFVEKANARVQFFVRTSG